MQYLSRIGRRTISCMLLIVRRRSYGMCSSRMSWSASPMLNLSEARKREAADRHRDRKSHNPRRARTARRFAALRRRSPCPSRGPREVWGLCRNGLCGLKAAMTTAPINVATPVAIGAKKNLVIYSGGLSSLLFSHAMCDLMGSSPSTTRSQVGHSNVCRTELAGPGSMRASAMRARHLRQRGRSIGISDGSTG